MAKVPRIVIVGGGFAGINAARELPRRGVQITLIDRTNHHTFQPLLYQVATAGLSPGDITAPIRWVMRKHRNAEVLLAEVTGFDLNRRVVRAGTFEFPYDYLIVAAGSTHAYFGHDEWEPMAPGLKTVDDAVEIRNRVLLAFELAERDAATRGRHEELNFIVVGGGPTGVEMAGTLAEITRTALAKDFRSVDPSKTHILLIEGGPRLLPTFPEDLAESARKQLQRLGVEVRTSAMVTGVEKGLVHAGSEAIRSVVTVWAAGVAASPLGRALGAPVDRAGRVIVLPDLSIPSHPEVFVLGDLASFKTGEGTMLPGLAPVAIQEGKATAANIVRDLENKQRQPFHYWDKGTLATIGRSAAVGNIWKIHITGFLAWMTWLWVHLFFLIGFRNRIVVMFQWAWSYFTYQRGVRLITGMPELTDMRAEETQRLLATPRGPQIVRK